MERLRGAAGVAAALGYRAAAGSAGIKTDSRHGVDDLALVLSEVPASAAGVFTTNRVKAAPVLWSQRVVRAATPVRAVLINSGNANACTGAHGHQVVRRCVGAVSRVVGCPQRAVLVASTGVIGVPMPVSGLEAAVLEAVGRLDRSTRQQRAAARAIMTTDTRPKEHAVRVRTAGYTYTVGGMAKGAGMIHPSMATMLAVITTDAPLDPRLARRLLSRATARTFNAITIDGDTSTNDTVLLLANGAAGGTVRAGSTVERRLGEALEAVCGALAEAIVMDGEGAAKLLVVRVAEARSETEAIVVARTIASSLLVKTAVHGGDPNWGRVLAAAGRSGVAVNPAKMHLRIGRHWVARGGTANPAGERGAAHHMRGRRVEMELLLGRGKASGFALGSDLTNEYVRINAHYRT